MICSLVRIGFAINSKLDRDFILWRLQNDTIITDINLNAHSVGSGIKVAAVPAFEL